MTDIYTKSVLTVIAVSLAVLAIQGVLPTAAQAQLGSGCGAFYDPCTVEISGTVDVSGSVEVSNIFPLQVQVVR
jgi:hypothetical protein